MATFEDKMTELLTQYSRMKKMMEEQAEKIEWLEEENNLLNCDLTNQKTVNENMKHHYEEATQISNDQIEDLKSQLKKVTEERDVLKVKEQKKLDSMKDYRIKNKEKVNANSRKYKKENKEKIDAQKSSPIKCGCGASVRRDNWSRHCKTKTHTEWEAKKSDV